MALILRDGSLFDAVEEGTPIGHGVNVWGAMGAGIAAEFKRRYPENYALYQEACSKRELEPGGLLTCDDGALPFPSIIIYNIASQEKPGPDARLDWLESGVALAIEDAKNRRLSKIALPRIGCGIGGLNWDEVKMTLEMLAAIYHFDIEVWTP